MALFLVTGPTSEPVTLAEITAHLRVDTTDDDALITTLMTAAREHVETFTRRALLPQTWSLKFDGFPGDREIWLPFPPVTAVSSITYLDTAGVTQTWAASNYLTDLPTGPKARQARITPAYSVTWPSTRRQLNAVTITFVCGYANAASVPYPITAAIKILIAHWYQYREPVIVGNIVNALPQSVEALLWPYRAY